MKRLLLNGCSYGIDYNFGTEARILGSRLGFDETVNLSQAGGSNERIFRTSVNYILEHQVDFVIISLTFYGRTESPWSLNDPIEGPWISHGGTVDYNWVENVLNRPILLSKHDIDNYLKHKVLTNWTHHYCDKLITDLICFTGWLESKNIKYCIFGACDMQYFLEDINQHKRQTIKSNLCIIDIENWSMNNFLYTNGGKPMDSETNIPPLNCHYKHEMNIDQYAKLNNFLYNHIINKCL
jgi:hypothetical protein